MKEIAKNKIFMEDKVLDLIVQCEDDKVRKGLFEAVKHQISNVNEYIDYVFDELEDLDIKIVQEED